MTTQAQVREIYLRVIDATIESLRADFNEKAAGERALESLEYLKKRWSDRLQHTHEFSDDPTVVENPSSASRNKKGSKAAKKKGAKGAQSPPANGAAPASDPNAEKRNSTIKAEDQKVLDDGKALPTVPRLPVSEGSKTEPGLESKAQLKPEDDPTAPPPAKRMRVEEKIIDDGQIENAAEDLDSDDSDDVEDSDEEAENLVLALHDRVRKGQKWKVILKEGIVSIRGREYLFNKATCDLDF